ncbi:TPA: hemagglutinin, partial [Escherichia coli]
MKKASKLLLALIPALSLSVFSAGVYAADASGINGTSYYGVTVDQLKGHEYKNLIDFWKDLGFSGKAYLDGKVVNAGTKQPDSVNIQNTAGKYLKYSLFDYGESGLTNTELRAPRSNEIVSYYDYANETAYFVNTKTNQILFSADGEGVVTTVGADGKTYSRHV